jgi:hypothetical protein
MVVSVTTLHGGVGSPTEYTVGVVEGMDIQLSYKGGPEPVYGSRIPIHSAGEFDATFTITRWYFADTGQEDLLLNLMQAELEFKLSGKLYDAKGNAVSNSTLTLTGCRMYKYRPRTGGANDIIGEEASGSATYWDVSGFITGETTP